MPDPATDLLLSIARCPNVATCKAGAAPHHCRRIVAVQTGDLDAFQVPEPWSGRIEQAPILFLSSNPGITAEERYPRWNWTDDAIADYFTNRFGGGREPWILDGNRRLNADGQHSEARPYWSNIKKRATEILGRDPVPGVDYALTEVVHCKSRQEEGVKQALRECAGRYLRPVLQLSAARVVVAVGLKVRKQLAETLGIRSEGALAGPLELAGRERLVLFLGHPAGPKAKTLAACLSADERRMVRAFALGV
ncbi:MAG: hypothetical protein AB7O97_06365 [Planctomycetota bacterium]